MTPVIFIGTSYFSVKCLEYLLDSDHFEVKAVVTVPDFKSGRGMEWQGSAVKIFSEKLGKPVFNPDNLSDESFLKKIAQTKSEFSIVCAYGKILPNIFLNGFPKKSVNIHPSLLPVWRGAAPIERSLMNGDQQTGVSLQFVGEKLDAGDIIAKVSYSIGEEETAKDIYTKAEEASKVLLQDKLVSYLKGELKPEPQLEEQVSYADKIEKKEAQIDWGKEAQIVHNKVRALVLGPQAFTFFRGQRLKVYTAKVLDRNPSKVSFGEVVSVDKKQLVISCGAGTLSLLEVQKEGRQKQKIAEFLKGTSVKLGDTFEV